MIDILVVEDHEKIRANLVLQLTEHGYDVAARGDVEQAEAWLEGNPRPRLMLLDIRLGKLSGVDLIRRLEEKKLLPPTIVVSGEATISETVEALRLGVYDFIEKPISRQRLLRSVTNCLEHHALKSKVDHLKDRLARGEVMLGDSQPMRNLRTQIERVAPSEGRVLIRGESGTGKELVANMIHKGSRRASQPFVKVNCAAIPANLIEDELFGHIRGAFTDARTDKPGLFEAARGGTLFLDEIGDMDVALQARLLRVLEDGMVRRIGDVRDRRVDVRIIAATHRNIEDMVGDKSFREDLFFRIGGIPLELPPLRERADDIPLLVSYYVTRSCEVNRIRTKQIDPEVFEVLKRYHWPGNVRELKNLCDRVVILGGDPIEANHLPSSVFREMPVVEGGIVPLSFSNRCLPLREFKAQCEKEYIENILHRTNGNYTEAARLLKIQRTYLYQKAASLGIRHG